MEVINSLSMPVEARAIRLLRQNLDSNEIAAHNRDCDLSYLVNFLDECWLNACFKKGWAKRASHGKVKWNTCMTDEHDLMIQECFLEGEKDKNKKQVIIFDG